MSDKRQQIVPAGAQPLYDNYHFAPATRVGDRIWLSGQVGIDANFVAGKDMEEQARFAFEAIKATLEAAGASLADVVELMSFHTDLRGEIADFVKVKDVYFPKDYPCWTAIGVTQLAAPEYKVEIRVVAVADSGAA
ncbi:Endoribonuclease L-PSP [Sphingopyxis sp. LC81]|uniref:RidA family protein n=1 Tax=Sphingopyxis sp. LC81 TaxID=1502850 RepID=UPI0005103E5E|nr:RidA family protein [Sphingopyxis sp. LC81]KGB53075.1 Endoribonuclease L-PSP [Sphingopyxis sp. LC81]